MAEGGDSVSTGSDQDQPHMHEHPSQWPAIPSQTDGGQSENTVNQLGRTRTPSEDIQDELQRALAECTLLSVPYDVPCKVKVTNIIGKVNISQRAPDSADGDIPDMVIERLESAKDIFVTTDAYFDVCDALDYHGHVLISGSPGSGKTTMALYIMDTYRKKKYRVKFVDDVTAFKVEDYVRLSNPTLLVLDDVFGKFAPTPEIKVRCTSMFNYLETHFKQLDKKRKREEDTEKHTDAGFSGNLKIIMCSRTNINKHSLVSNLLDKYKTSLFRPSTINDLTVRELKDSEKENILRRHLRKTDKNVTQADIKRIAQLKYQTLGFPYICHLFVDSCSKDNAIQFFENPWEYLLQLIKDIFSDCAPNYRAAVLLLMVLNAGTLNLTDLLTTERRTDSGLYRRLKSVQEIVPNTLHPQSLVEAAKREIRTLVMSDKNSILFSHPTVYDVVSFVVGEKNPVFILENCSLQFIIERTKVSEECRTEASSRRDEHSFVIYLDQTDVILTDLLVERLAREIINGHIALPLSHQCLISGSFVDCLFSVLSKHDNFERCLHSHDTVNGLGFLYWSSFASPNPTDVSKCLFQHTSFEVSEILEGYLGCCMSGNVFSLQTLAAKSERWFDQIATVNIGDILGKEKETKLFVRSLSTACSPTKAALGPEKVTPRMHGDNKDKLIHVAAANGFTGVVELLLDRVGTPIDVKGGNDMTALMYSCYLGHSDLTERLIHRGANPELLDEEGDNCLHLTCRGGSVDIAKSLIAVNMDINKRGEHGRTPLMYASYNGHEDMVKLLLEKGALPNPDVSSIDEKDNCLHLACVKGELRIVKVLLDQAKVDIESRGERARTPLMYACRHGQLETVKELIARHANTNVLDETGFSCLHLAAMKGHVPTAEWLLSVGQRIDVDCTNEAGRTPLMYAMRNGHAEMVDLLIAHGSDISVKDNSTVSCLHMAVQSGRWPLIELCLDEGHDVNACSKAYQTPAMRACRQGDLNLFKRLVEKGANVSLGDGCLSAACINGSLEIVDYLLSTFPSIDINRCDLKNRSAIMTVSFHGHTDVVEYLQSKGADILQRDQYGQTCLHVACRSGHIETAERLLQAFPIDVKDNNGMTPFMFALKANYFDMVDFLVEHGADMNVQNNRGQTSLHTSAWHGNAVGCARLLDLGMHVDVHDSSKRTPLMCVSKSRDDRSEVINILLERGADINVRDKDGNTCLHIAAESGGHIATTELLVEHQINTKSKLLLERGLDVNAQNEHGVTPLMCAARQGNRAVVDLLINSGANVNVTDLCGQDCIGHAKDHGHYNLADYMSKL